jgi:6-carboxyhexanoate--CoA ligase
MMNDELYSIRMRASLKGGHISGAERIVAEEKIDDVMRELAARAMNKTAVPDEIVIKVEALRGKPLRTLPALDVVTLSVPDAQAGRSAAVRVLQQTGVSGHAALAAIDCLSKGAAPSGRNMRGAILMDAQSSGRLEPDQERGVRASRFDWSREALKDIELRLGTIGLTHERTREALALATKVAHAPGVVAELCWSDEPDYTAGYVASLQTGYVRFSCLKENGDPKGGRVFFVNVNNLNLDGLVTYLQVEPVMIVKTGECGAAVTPDEYFRT